jgi:hypothetical protein
MIAFSPYKKRRRKRGFPFLWPPKEQRPPLGTAAGESWRTNLTQ